MLGYVKKFSVTVFLSCLLAGCTSGGFKIQHIGKTDVDMVQDLVIVELELQLQTLTKKLYRRNPAQLQKTPSMTVAKRLEMLFGSKGRLIFAELGQQQELAAIELALQPAFTGDRVFALMTGLTGMLRKSYGYDADFYFYEDLDPQLLYNSARNIEVMAWKLKNAVDAQGRPLIITHRSGHQIDNLSFERLYGKLINTQDVVAKIVADSENRAIKTVIQTSLSMFLPI